MADKIEKSIELNANSASVWQALSDYREFGKWFRVAIEGPFVVGQAAKGHITYPGYEHLKWEVQVKAIEPEHLLSFTWHPYAVDPDVDYSSEVPTLVEFRLAKKGNNTLLTVSESGFDKVPETRREEAYRMNSGGWAEQVKNIEEHLKQNKLVES